ncbi:MAG: hypothetical protein MJY93_02805 [Fibrobacter sp.]|nr:hypothetical protein [Fibrobacter sp.]
MESSKSLQQKVNELYIETFKNESDLPLCIPLLPRINDAYLKDRIMIVGQETNGWYSNFGNYNGLVHNPSRMVELSLEAYDDFTKYAVLNNGNNIFWTFLNELYKKVFKRDIVDADGNLGHVWLNVFLTEAIDYFQKQGKPSTESKIAAGVLKQQDRLLYHLLKLLKPRIILFLSGPKLDWALEQYVFSENYAVGCLTFSKGCENSSFGSNAFAKVEMKNVIPELAETKIYRMYHPNHFRYLGKDGMDEYKKYVFEVLQNSL